MKKLGLLLIAFILSCGFTSILSIAQAQTKPAIPEFTVKLVDNSYDVPPTQTTDPYTGTVTNPGYHVEQKAIEITIKNQNYPSKIMYNIRTKGHYEQEWREYFTASPNFNPYPTQTTGQYTIITIPDNEKLWPDNAKVDFQVETLSGISSFKSDMYGEMTSEGRGIYVFDGVTSGWSKTQTLTINKYSNEIPNQQPNNTETPSNPNQPTGFSWIELVVITAIVAIIAVTITVFILRKTVQLKTV
jgi:hypothetical protein